MCMFKHSGATIAGTKGCNLEIWSDSEWLSTLSTLLSQKSIDSTRIQMLNTKTSLHKKVDN